MNDSYPAVNWKPPLTALGRVTTVTHPKFSNKKYLSTKPGVIGLFQRAKPMLSAFDPGGKFLRSLGAGLFDHPHGLRIDADDNLWTTDVAFSSHGDIYVADGYGNSRIVKFDRDGNFLKAWGSYGSGPGEFILPHSVAVDGHDRVYVGDRENGRIQIFDAEGRFLAQWTGIGYPYGLYITPDQHVRMIGDGYDYRSPGWPAK